MGLPIAGFSGLTFEQTQEKIRGMFDSGQEDQAAAAEELLANFPELNYQKQQVIDTMYQYKSEKRFDEVYDTASRWPDLKEDRGILSTAKAVVPSVKGYAADTAAGLISAAQIGRDINPAMALVSDEATAQMDQKSKAIQESLRGYAAEQADQAQQILSESNVPSQRTMKRGAMNIASSMAPQALSLAGGAFLKAPAVAGGLMSLPAGEQERRSFKDAGYSETASNAAGIMAAVSSFLTNYLPMGKLDSNAVRWLKESPQGMGLLKAAGAKYGSEAVQETLDSVSNVGAEYGMRLAGAQSKDVVHKDPGTEIATTALVSGPMAAVLHGGARAGAGLRSRIDQKIEGEPYEVPPENQDDFLGKAGYEAPPEVPTSVPEMPAAQPPEQPAAPVPQAPAPEDEMAKLEEEIKGVELETRRLELEIMKQNTAKMRKQFEREKRNAELDEALGPIARRESREQDVRQAFTANPPTAEEIEIEETQAEIDRNQQEINKMVGYEEASARARQAKQNALNETLGPISEKESRQRELEEVFAAPEPEKPRYEDMAERARLRKQAELDSVLGPIAQRESRRRELEETFAAPPQEKPAYGDVVERTRIEKQSALDSALKSVAERESRQRELEETFSALRAPSEPEGRPARTEEEIRAQREKDVEETLWRTALFEGAEDHYRNRKRAQDYLEKAPELEQRKIDQAKAYKKIYDELHQPKITTDMNGLFVEDEEPEAPKNEPETIVQEPIRAETPEPVEAPTLEQAPVEQAIDPVVEYNGEAVDLSKYKGMATALSQVARRKLPAKDKAELARLVKERSKAFYAPRETVTAPVETPAAVEPITPADIARDKTLSLKEKAAKVKEIVKKKEPESQGKINLQNETKPYEEPFNQDEYDKQVKVETEAQNGGPTKSEIARAERLKNLPKLHKAILENDKKSVGEIAGKISGAPHGPQYFLEQLKSDEEEARLRGMNPPPVHEAMRKLLLDNGFYEEKNKSGYTSMMWPKETQKKVKAYLNEKKRESKTAANTKPSGRGPKKNGTYTRNTKRGSVSFKGPRWLAKLVDSTLNFIEDESGSFDPFQRMAKGEDDPNLTPEENFAKRYSDAIFVGHDQAIYYTQDLLAMWKGDGVPVEFKVTQPGALIKSEKAKGMFLVTKKTDEGGKPKTIIYIDGSLIRAARGLSGEEAQHKVLAHEIGHLIHYIGKEQNGDPTVGFYRILEDFGRVSAKERNGLKNSAKTYLEAMEISEKTGHPLPEVFADLMMNRVGEKGMEEGDWDRYRIQAESLNVTRAWRGIGDQQLFKNWAYFTSDSELFADFSSAMLNKPNWLRSYAPALWAKFWDYTQKNPAALEKMKQYAKYVVLRREGKAPRNQLKKFMKAAGESERAFADKMGGSILGTKLAEDPVKQYKPSIITTLRYGADDYWIAVKRDMREEDLLAFQDAQMVRSKVDALDQAFKTGFSELRDKKGIFQNEFDCYLLNKNILSRRSMTPDEWNPEEYHVLTKEVFAKMLQSGKYRDRELTPEELEEVEGLAADRAFKMLDQRVISPLSVKDAEDVLAELYESMKERGIENPERDLEQLTGKFHAVGVSHFVDVVDAMEVFDDKMLDEFRRNRYFGHWLIVDYFDDKFGAGNILSGTVKRLSGTFKMPAPLSYSTLMKRRAIIAAANRSHMNRLIVSTLAKNNGARILDYSKDFDFKKKEWKNVGKNFGIIEYMYKGSRKAAKVSKYMADLVENDPGLAIISNEMLRAADAVMNSTARTLWVSSNMKFWSFDLPRGWVEAWFKIPGSLPRTSEFIAGAGATAGRSISDMAGVTIDLLEKKSDTMKEFFEGNPLGQTIKDIASRYRIQPEEYNELYRRGVSMDRRVNYLVDRVAENSERNFEAAVNFLESTGVGVDSEGESYLLEKMKSGKTKSRVENLRNSLFGRAMSEETAKAVVEYLDIGVEALEWFRQLGESYNYLTKLGVVKYMDRNKTRYHDKWEKEFFEKFKSESESTGAGKINPKEEAELRKKATRAANLKVTMVVRDLAGLPNTQEKGAWSPWITAATIFANVQKNGLKATYKGAQMQAQEAREAGFPLPSIFNEFSLKTGIVLATSWALREAFRAYYGEREFNKFPEYASKGTFLIPTPIKSSEGRYLYFKLPLEESVKTMNGIFQELMDSTVGKTISEKITNSAVTATNALTPGVSPTLKIGEAWTCYFLGRTPFDWFLQSDILTEATRLEGGARAWGEMAKWSWNAYGLGTIYQMTTEKQKYYDPPERGAIDQLLYTTGISLPRFWGWSAREDRKTKYREEKNEERNLAIEANRLSDLVEARYRGYDYDPYELEELRGKHPAKYKNEIEKFEKSNNRY